MFTSRNLVFSNRSQIRIVVQKQLLFAKTSCFGPVIPNIVQKQLVFINKKVVVLVKLFRKMVVVKDQISTSVVTGLSKIQIRENL